MAHTELSYRRILTHIITCSGIRDIARDLKVSPSTILNRISRLSRQTIAIHSELCSHMQLCEPLVVGKLESYAVSQSFPNIILFLAGKESQFWYATDYSQLRRRGVMNGRQKSRNVVVQSCFSSARKTLSSPVLRIMETLGKLQRRGSERCGIVHARVSSRMWYSISNPLFSVKYLNRQIRKDCAEHVRDTVKYARNVNNSLERLAIYRFFHNYQKAYRIGQKPYEKISHAMKAGMDKAEIDKQKKTLFTQRRFLGRTGGLSFCEALVWLRGIATPLKRYAEYLPAYVWN